MHRDEGTVLAIPSCRSHSPISGPSTSSLTLIVTDVLEKRLQFQGTSLMPGVDHQANHQKNNLSLTPSSGKLWVLWVFLWGRVLFFNLLPPP